MRKPPGTKPGNGNATIRCAIYTRKSSEEGLEQAFNSLDAQREACETFIASQKHEGWVVLPTLYDDGGISGGTTDRPALQRLLADIAAGSIDTVVVYKVDRLTRLLGDFAKIVEVFDRCRVSFVSVTQQFNTTTSMGRLTLNMLLSFAQFEREVTGERIRDKIAASKRKGMWMGGLPPLGYDARDRKLIVNETEADTVRQIFRRYAQLRSVRELQLELVSWIRSSPVTWLGCDAVSEALDAGQDVGGGLGPAERLGVGIGLVDERGDRIVQRGEAATDAAAELPIGQQGEEPFHLVEPSIAARSIRCRRHAGQRPARGGAGRRVVDVPVRPLAQPGADRRCLVGGVVVHDEVDLDLGRDLRRDRVEEAAELGGPVPGEALADDPPGGDVERRDQRGRAVPLVVVRAPLDLARTHRQQRPSVANRPPLLCRRIIRLRRMLAAVERLDLALLVDAPDQRPIRRGQVEADHVAHLGDEVGVGRELEGRDPVRLQAEGAPDPLHGGGRPAAGPGHRV